MAVTSVEAISEGLGGSASGTDSGSIKLEYRASFRVTTDSLTSTQEQVLTHFRRTASLPWPPRRYRFGADFNSSVLCKTVSADAIVNTEPRQFLVNCTFANPEFEFQDMGQDESGQTTNDPFRWRDEIEVSVQTMTMPVEQAKLLGFDPLVTQPTIPPGYFGPIINSCGDPADPTLEEDVRIKTVRITKYFRDYNESFFNQYQDAINSDAFTINKPAYNFIMHVREHCAKFGQISASFGMTGNIKYYRATGELLITSLPYGWLRPVTDRGRNKITLPNGTDLDDFGQTVSPGDDVIERRQFTEPIRDKIGDPIMDPVLLDGMGRRHPQTYAPILFIWQTKPMLPFSAIQW